MTTHTTTPSPEAPPRLRLRRLERHRSNPFKRPDWRWRLAEELAVPGTRTTRAERAEVGPALRYLRDRAAARGTRDLDRLRRRHALVCSALRIRNGDEFLRAEIEARLLARQPVDEIAELVGVPASVIMTYAHYFFDLPADGDGEDWVREAVLNAGAWLDRDPTEYETWKVLAYYGGVLVLDVVVDDYRQRLGVDPVARHRLAERGRFLVRDRAMLMRTPIPDARWFAECELLFPDPVKDTGDELQIDICKLQFEFLRYAAGLSAAPAPAPVQGTSKPPEPSFEELCHAASKIRDIQEAFDSQPLGHSNSVSSRRT